MSSCVVVKKEVTGEMEEEDEEELKRRRRRQRKALQEKERMERIRRICAGEDVPGVGDEERRKILEKEEKRKERRALNEKQKRELMRKVCAGEDVPGIGEEERRRIIEMHERTKQRKRKHMRKIEKYEKQKERAALYAKEKRERIRRICAGEDVPGVGEEERIKIIQEEEKRKERERLHKRNKSLEKREELNAKAAEYKKKKMKEETAEEREARLAKNRFQYLVRSVQRTRTEEEKERQRRTTFFWKQARKAMMSEEEWEEEKRRRNEYCRERRKNFSEEKRKEYLEKLKGSVKRSLQKFKERDPEGYKKRMREYQRRNLQRLSEKFGVKNNEWGKYYQKKRYEGMSEDEKRRRLNQMKMYQQKRNLRRKLEGTVDDEEIKRRLDELDKRLREELGIGPSRSKGWLRRKGSDYGAVDIDARCSREVSTGLAYKQEVGQWSADEFLNLNSQAEQLEQAESNFCDYDGDEGASMPSPPAATQLNSPLHNAPPQQLEPVPVTRSIALERVSLPMSSPPEENQINILSPPPPQHQFESVTPSIVPEIAELKFSCEYCECPPFLTENDLRSHLRDSHLKICWKCPSCKEVMISSKHLSEHFKAVHKKPSILSSSLTVDTHCHYSQENSNSRKIGNSFSSKAEFFCLRCPLKSVNSSKIITVFKDWKGLHSHVRNKHRKYYWPCEYCHLLKYSKQSLNVHLMLCTKKSET